MKKTFGFKTLQVNKGETALLLRNGDFVRVLPPGRHRVRAWGDALELLRPAAQGVAFEHPLADYAVSPSSFVI